MDESHTIGSRESHGVLRQASSRCNHFWREMESGNSAAPRHRRRVPHGDLIGASIVGSLAASATGVASAPRYVSPIRAACDAAQMREAATFYAMNGDADDYCSDDDCGCAFNHGCVNAITRDDASSLKAADVAPDLSEFTSIDLRSRSSTSTIASSSAGRGGNAWMSTAAPSDDPETRNVYANSIAAAVGAMSLSASADGTLFSDLGCDSLSFTPLSTSLLGANRHSIESDIDALLSDSDDDDDASLDSGAVNHSGNGIDNSGDTGILNTGTTAFLQSLGNLDGESVADGNGNGDEDDEDDDDDDASGMRLEDLVASASSARLPATSSVARPVIPGLWTSQIGVASSAAIRSGIALARAEPSEGQNVSFWRSGRSSGATRAPAGATSGMSLDAYIGAAERVLRENASVSPTPALEISARESSSAMLLRSISQSALSMARSPGSSAPISGSVSTLASGGAPRASAGDADRDAVAAGLVRRPRPKLSAFERQALKLGLPS